MSQPVLKLVVNCGLCEEFIEKCVASLQSQSYPHWQAYLTVDLCGDRTFERALAACGADDRIAIHRNEERQYSMVNLINGVRRSQAQPEDVLVAFDGDDWFATPEALSRIASTYENYDCWLTYGSWIADHEEFTGIHRGMWPAYESGTEDFRNSEWLGTAVRTWKRWLWELIDDNDFRDEQGQYFRVTEDQACMLPMLEMAGTERARHIAEALMIYNRSTPHSCGKNHYEEMLANSRYLRSRPPYPRLQQKPLSVEERPFRLFMNPRVRVW